jgi:hypothetical protein
MLNPSRRPTVTLPAVELERQTLFRHLPTVRARRASRRFGRGAELRLGPAPGTTGVSEPLGSLSRAVDHGFATPPAPPRRRRTLWACPTRQRGRPSFRARCRGLGLRLPIRCDGGHTPSHRRGALSASARSLTSSPTAPTVSIAARVLGGEPAYRGDEPNGFVGTGAVRPPRRFADRDGASVSARARQTVASGLKCFARCAQA